MPATTTLATLLTDLAEENDLGLVISGATGATTTITNSATAGISELKGPFTGAKIPVGSPVTVITAGTVGEDSYVSNFVASTGVVTLSPAITTDATGFIIWNPEIKHGKNVEKAISRAHQKCRRWQKVPLTYVPDGEMLATTVTSYWTSSAGTPSYVSLATPEVAAGRVLQISHTSAENAQSNTIPARAGEVWEFETAIRVTTDGDTATFSVRDITNSVEITVTYSVGDGATTSRAFQTLRGTFTVPGTADTGARIAFRIAVSGSGTMTAQMAPLIAFPRDAMSFPFTNRVLGLDRVGNFYYGDNYGTNAGPDERGYSETLLGGGRAASFSDNGDHLVVSFNFAPCGPVYYDELVYGGALTALTDTVVFNPEYVKLQARATLYDFLMRSELRGLKKLENGLPAPSAWRVPRNAAVKSARWSLHEPELMNIRR